MSEKEKQLNGVASKRVVTNKPDVPQKKVVKKVEGSSEPKKETKPTVKEAPKRVVTNKPDEPQKKVEGSSELKKETKPTVKEAPKRVVTNKPDESQKKVVKKVNTNGVSLATEERIAKLEDNVEQQREKERKQKKKIIIRNILIFVLLIIIILLLLRSCSSGPQMDVTPEVERMVYDIPAEYDMKEHEDGKVAVMGWNEGQKVISMSNPALVLKNVSANAGHYYLQFTVTEDGEELFKSGLVAPASMIAPDFPKDMDLGEHDVIVSVTAYAMNDTSKPLSTSNIALKIIMTK